MKSNTTFTETLFTGAGRVLLMFVIFLGACDSQVEQAPDQVHSKAGPVEAYIDRWVAFYPSAAFGQGMKSAALRFEDFSESRVADWVAFNRTTEKILASVPETAALQERIDARVLLRQLKFELDLWDKDWPIPAIPHLAAATTRRGTPVPSRPVRNDMQPAVSEAMVDPDGQERGHADQA